LKVIEHVINLNGGIAKPSDYTIHINGNNQSPDTFLESEEGTDVTLGFDSYSFLKLLLMRLDFRQIPNKHSQI
jgi:hypothetical protein